MKIVISSFLCAVAMVLFYSTAFSQVLNAGFENELPQGGGIQFWGNTTLMPFPSDSVVIDSALYFRNDDPHSGKHALELRNGYAPDITMSGNVSLSDEDSVYGGFARGMAFTETPKYFTFYYKFFPASASDTARATATLLNAVDGTIRGTAELLISKATPQYTEAIVPILYTGDGAPSHLFIQFSTRTAASTASYGTRFLVDDVGLRNSVSSVHSSGTDQYRINCAVDRITKTISFLAENTTDKLTISIFTLTGEKLFQSDFTSSLLIEAAAFAKGIYFYTITSEHHPALSGKFLLP